VRRLLVAVVLASALVPAAAARANVYAEVLHVYQVDGTIPPCRFTSAQLSTALKGIDTYGQQYFADFSNAVQNALAARASGACSVAAQRAVLSARGARGAAPPPLPASLTAPTDAGLPAPIVVMALVALIAGAVLGVRWVAIAGGWEPEWALRWRHAWGEAEYRLAGRWGEWVDRLRGRGR
jgi:hypothetical protein